MFYEFVIYRVAIEAGSDNEITDLLRSQTPDVLSARRILQYPDRSPTTFVRVRVQTRECQHQYLRYGCVINGFFHRTEHSKRRQLWRRCYQCQAISTHVARTCPNRIKCLKCAGAHLHETCNETFEKCANCDGPHTANSLMCKHWITQTQLSREWGGDRGTTEHDVIRLLKEVKTEMESRFNGISDHLKSVQDDIMEMKCTITSQLQLHRNENRSPDMTWDEYDLNASHPHSPEEISDEDFCLNERSKEPKPTNALETRPLDLTTENECHSLPEAMHSSTPTMTTIHTDDSVNSVNSNIEKHNETVLENCDTAVDAQTTMDKPRTVEKGFRCPNDPVYRDYYDRINKWTRQDIVKFKNYFNLFRGEVLFRYCDGSISSKIINVISPDRSVSNIKPCAAPISTVKNLATSEILCCPFHHLASEIKDTVNREDLVYSFGEWRTKDLSAYCRGWQSSFHKSLQKKYGRKK